MSVLSIFVDESGDFGKVDNNSPYYFVTLVFHDQTKNIQSSIAKLEETLWYFDDKIPRTIHTAPLIRRESPYYNLTIDERRSLIYKMLSFFRHSPILHTTIKVDRRTASDKMHLSAGIARRLQQYVNNHLCYFASFEKIIVYYDNGQQELNTILNVIFSLLMPNVEFRKASPSEYRLLQLADFICTMEHLSVKMSENRLSSSEKAFFYKPQELKKTFIKSLRAKALK